jgi:hypothetical protein
MSRFDIVTGRESEDTPSVEDTFLAVGKKLEMLTDSMERSKLESFVVPDQYVPYHGQHTSSPDRVMMRMSMPTGRQYMIPVQEANIVTGSRDIFLQIRITPQIAEDINSELRGHDPHYMSTQSLWEQEDQRIRARRLLRDTRPDSQGRYATANDIDRPGQREMIWHSQPPQPGELTEDQMRNILNEPL